MSLDSTKIRLIALLADPDNKVIALSGLWGTGKSHLWHEVKRESNDERIKGALYVSLFGVTTLAQVKQKLVQALLPTDERNASRYATVRQGISSAVKVATGFHSGFSALLDIPQLLAPTLLKDKIIVIDDIERKHMNLDIDELLGFIDEFTQQFGARFVLILNTDKLEQRNTWDTLREKVIDNEVVLDTSASEAFDIADIKYKTRFAPHVRKAVESCRINNIRVIQRIIKTCETILSQHDNVTNEVLGRVIPSTVLLTAIHLRGITDGPPLEFVLQTGTKSDWRLDDQVPQDDNIKAKRSAWGMLLVELGINGCDEYEELVVEFLQKSSIDTAGLNNIIARYVHEQDAMNVHSEVRRFYSDVHWNFRIENAALLERARGLVDKVKFLGPDDMTSLSEFTKMLDGGDEVSQQLVDAWVADFTNRPAPEQPFDNIFGRRIHPDIQAALERMEAVAQQQKTLYDACFQVAARSSWGIREEAALKRVTVADFEELFDSSTQDEVRTVIRKMTEFTASKDRYERHFGGAMDVFVEACKKVIREQAYGRLGAIIKSVFASAGIAHLLETEQLE